MSQDPDSSFDPSDDTEVGESDANQSIDKVETHDSNRPAGEDAEEGTGATDPRHPVATVKHLSDSLIGETVTLSSSDETVIGNFRLTNRLGTGAFGIVYAADDLRLDRKVALKVPFAVKGEDAAEYYKRVFREGRAAAALDHPNIVSVYDVAERNGQPFIVSQLIEGPSLYDRNTSGRMDQRKAAEMTILIARALAYAHKRGIVHRDLKPGNILLDQDGAPHVNDFGIAKYESVDETISTENSIIGTPAYMSPEQAAGHSRDADRRSDLYSIGVILYELITGERPFRGSSRMLLHQVIHDEPQRPRQLVQSIHRDLETICLKCMEKDPARRYADCDELADELERFLAGDAIRARPVSQIEHAWRKCRRHPVATALGVAFLVSLGGGFAGVTWQWRRAEANRAMEQVARREAERSRQELAEEVEYSNRLLYGAQMSLAGASVTLGDYQQAEKHLGDPNGSMDKYRDIEYSILRNRVDRYEHLLQHIEQITDVAISDDETMIAACGLRTLLLWDVESGHVILRNREKKTQLRCVAFAPRKDLIAWSGQSGQISFAAPKTPGQQQTSLDHGAGVRAIAFSDDGSKILSAGDDGKIVIWSVETKEKLRTLEVHKGPVFRARFVGSGQVISGGQQGKVCLSDVATGEHEVLLTGRKPVTAIGTSSDGKYFAVAWENAQALGELERPEDAKYFGPAGFYVVDFEFVDEPHVLVASRLSGEINVWNLPEVRSARKHRCVKGFGSVAFARHSNRIIAGSGDGAIQAIRLEDAAVDEINIDCKSLTEAAFMDDARSVIVCPDQGPAQVVHLKSGRLVREIPDYADDSIPASLRGCNLLCVDESEDGKKLAFGTNTGQVLIWNVADAKLRVHGTGGGRGILFVRLVDNASSLVSGGEDGAVRVWDLRRANQSTEIARHGGVIRGLEVSPDKSRLAAVAADGSVTLIQTGTWEIDKRMETEHILQCVGWARDSNRLAVGNAKGGTLVYRADLSGEPIRLLGHAGPVSCVAFSPTGQTLVTGGNDDDIRFWDLQTGQTKMVWRIHDRNIRTISISRDGAMVLTADAGGLVRLWQGEI